MKKVILLGIISLNIGIASQGQIYDRFIRLDNYSNEYHPDPPIVYGYGMPANGVSGVWGMPGTGLSSDWTVGLYWAPGTTGLDQPAGFDMPDLSLTLATGTGSTAVIATQNAEGEPGYYDPFPAWNCGPNTTITLEIVVYPTAAGSYPNALYRMHSAAFSMPTSLPTAFLPNLTGDYMPGQMFISPEPSTIAMGGLGLVTLFAFRRVAIK